MTVDRVSDLHEVNDRRQAQIDVGGIECRSHSRGVLLPRPGKLLEGTENPRFVMPL
jgi:hypothetical protein